MPIITCPHCGARRNTPQEKLPHKPVKARCPECRENFDFDPAEYRKNTTETTPETEEITCPHCGLPRTIPHNRPIKPQATVNCRRCQRAFRLLPPHIPPEQTTNSEAIQQLRSIGALLADSWEIFCHRGWGLLAIYLLGSLLVFVPLLAAAMLLPDKLTGNQNLAWACLAAGISYGLFGLSWMAASMFNHVCHPELGVIAALGHGLRKLWSFTLLLLLLGLIVTGGSLLFVIPGLIFSIWFFFCQFILADEGIGGMHALEKSRQLVRGHWWAVGGRFILLLLVAVAVSILSGRLPVIGAPVNFAFSLLLVPFSLIYYSLIYQDLKVCHPGTSQPNRPLQVLTLTAALFGWLLIPATLQMNNYRQNFTNAELSITQQGNISKFLYSSQGSAEEQNAEPKTEYPEPKALTLADYDRLLKQSHTTVSRQGVKLGPATLSAEHFWTDEQNPHLWLKLQLENFPNLTLAPQHSARILIDKVLDSMAQDRYNRGHSFEQPAFQWVSINDSAGADNLSGIRNVYLREGTRPEQIRSISGQLEINLPLNIKSLRLSRDDIGKTLQIAGKKLTLKNFGKEGVSLSFLGKRSELLSIRAVNQADEPLREAGSTWQKNDDSIDLKQMFNGQIEQVTVLVASDSVTRRYPFEITQ